MVLKLRVGENLKNKHKTIIRRAATGKHFQTQKYRVSQITKLERHRNCSLQRRIRNSIY